MTTFTSVTNGNWNVATTWGTEGISGSGSPVAGTHYPAAGHHAVADTGDTVTLVGASAASSIRILGTIAGGSQTLTLSGASSNKPFDNDGTITGDLNLVITNTSAQQDGTVVDMTGGSGNVNDLTLNLANGTTANKTVTLLGATTLDGDLTITSGTLDTDSSSNYALTVDGDVSVTGTLTGNASAISLGSLTIASGGTYSATSGTTTITNKSGTNYSIENLGTFTHNNGKVFVDTTGVSANPDVKGSAFYDFEMKMNASTQNCSFRDDATATDTVVFYGDLTITKGNFENNVNSDTFIIHGNTYIAADGTMFDDADQTGTVTHHGLVTNLGTYKTGSGVNNFNAGIRNLGKFYSDDTLTLGGTGGILEGNFDEAPIDVKLDGVLEFNNTSDKIQIAADTDIQHTQVTFSCWFKTPDVTGVTNDYLTLYDDRGDTNDPGFFLGVYDDSQKMMFYAGSGDGPEINILSNDAIPINTWMHVAVTIDKTGNASKMYINGVLQTATDSADGYEASTENIQIGKNGYDDIRYWNGNLADIRVYKDVLDLAEIQVLASKINGDIALGAGATNLKLYLPLTIKNSGTTCAESIASGDETDDEITTTLANVENYLSNGDYILIGDEIIGPISAVGDDAEKVGIPAGSGGRAMFGTSTAAHSSGDVIYIVRFADESGENHHPTLSGDITTPSGDIVFDEFSINVQEGGRKLADIGKNVNGAEFASSTTATVITLEASHGVVAGDVIQMGTERMFVSSVSTNELTVLRGIGGTTAATQADGIDVFYATATHINGTLKIIQGKLEGKSLSCLHFDGDNDQVLAPTPVLTTTQTVSLWFNADVVEASTFLLGNSSGSTFYNPTDGWSLFIRDTDTNAFAVGVEGTQTNCPALSSALSAGRWYNLIWTADGADFNFYLDGVHVGQVTSGAALQAQTLTAYMALSNTTTGETAFDGKMRDLRIYKYELSSDQAASLYSGSYNVTPDYWWKFDEGSGGTSDDLDDSGTATDADGDARNFAMSGGGSSDWNNGVLDIDSILTVEAGGTLSAPRGRLEVTGSTSTAEPTTQFKATSSYIHNNGTFVPNKLSGTHFLKTGGVEFWKIKTEVTNQCRWVEDMTVIQEWESGGTNYFSAGKTYTFGDTVTQCTVRPTLRAILNGSPGGGTLGVPTTWATFQGGSETLPAICTAAIDDTFGSNDVQMKWLKITGSMDAMCGNSKATLQLTGNVHCTSTMVVGAHEGSIDLNGYVLTVDGNVSFSQTHPCNMDFGGPGSMLVCGGDLDMTYLGLTIDSGAGAGVVGTTIISNGDLALPNGTSVLTAGTFVDGASGHTNGTYNNVLLEKVGMNTDGVGGGNGGTCYGTVVVSGGSISAVTITQGGSGYTVADVLVIPDTSIGGSNEDGSCRVASLTGFVGDSTTNIMYNASGTFTGSATYAGNIIAGAGEITSASSWACNDINVATGGTLDGDNDTITCAGNFTTSGGLLGASCLTLNGSSEHAYQDTGNNYSIVNAFTFEHWMKSASTGDDSRVMDMANGVNGNNRVVHTFDSNLPRFKVESDSVTATTAVNDSKWHHIAGTYDGTIMKIYVDGKLEGTHTPSSGNLRASEAMEMWIGCGIDAAGGTFYTGEIDDFRIWSEVRTATEIRANMFDETPTDSNSKLEAHWKFNEGTGTTDAIDSAEGTTARDLTLNNVGGWAAAGTFDGTDADHVLKMTGAGKSLNYLSGEVLGHLNIDNSSGTVTANVLHGTNNLSIASLIVGGSGSFTAPTGTTTITSRAGAGYQLYAAASDITHGDGTFVFEGAAGGSSYINMSGTSGGVNGIYNATINASGRTVTVSTSDLHIKNDLTVTAGTLTPAAGRTLTVLGDVDVTGTLNCDNGEAYSLGSLAIQSGGTYEATAGTTTITGGGGGWAINNVSNGTFTHNNGTVLLTDSTENWVNLDMGSGADNDPLKNLTISRATTSYDVFINDPLVVAGNLIITNSGLNTGNNNKALTVTGDVTIGDGSGSANTAEILGRASAVEFGSLTIDSDGLYSATSGTTTITGDDGGEAYKNNGTFTHNNGLLLFSQTAASSAGYFNILNASTAGTHTFYDLKINAASSSAHHSYFHRDIKVLNKFTKVGVRNFANTGGSVAKTLTVHGLSKLENGILGDASTTGTYAFLGGLDITGGTLQIGSSHTIQASGIRNIGGTIT